MLRHVRAREELSMTRDLLECECSSWKRGALKLKRSSLTLGE